ncbi:MAG: pantoate--beta-alanine ligase, partial [Lentisphaeria bacterium]|nr:pantoate--beta-alanine ligase [Lentisphaeria bacterium]
TIGFVPTMGYLHARHMSLIDIARGKADTVIVSVFVNPTQFGPEEDFDRYPRDFERDMALCREHGADAVFAPEKDEMYDADATTWVEEKKLSGPLCGASRPCFFRGVTTVVSKLFNLTQPDFAVFGWKDAQQLLVIRRMVRDLDFPVTIIGAPLVRDTDGLALSSRNRYLSDDERARALTIHRSLLAVRRSIEEAGNTGVLDKALADARTAIAASGGKIDYVTALDLDTLEAPTSRSAGLLVAAAVFYGATRLIDNEVIEFRKQESV